MLKCAAIVLCVGITRLHQPEEASGTGRDNLSARVDNNIGLKQCLV